MKLKTYLFLGQYLIIYNIFDAAFATPIFGENVREAKVGEFSSVVAIMIVDNDIEKLESKQLCTGVLITKEHILTAAHCLEEIEISETEIIAGSRDLTCGKKYRLSWWVTYNDWATRYRGRIEFEDNDVAVLKLKEEVSNELKPINLSTISNKNTFGQEVVAAGWGITNNEENPKILRTVNLRVLSNIICEDKIEKEMIFKIPIHERLLCTHANPHSLLMPGDSGAPIFLNGTLLAIHRSTVPYPELRVHPNKLNIHSSIDYYRRFIINVISINNIWS